jgi:glycosyltransferase involved in cell wall biosynthesis
MDSVAAQTFHDWEHLVVDDGSGDGTFEEVTKRAAIDSRVRYIKRAGERSGANVCRNLGVRHSRAGLIVFLDSDDLLAPHCLAQRIDILQRNPDLDFAVFPGSVFTNTLEDRNQLFSPMQLGSDLDRFLFLDYPWEITGPIWRQIALERIGLFSEDLPSWQDVELHIRAIVAGAKYLKFDVPDHYIRWKYEPTKISVLQFSSHDHLEKAIDTIDTLHRQITEAGLLNWYRRRAFSGLIFLLAERWTRTGRFFQGLRVWSLALRRGFASLVLQCLGVIVLLFCRLMLFAPEDNEHFLEKFKRAAGFRI